MVVALDDAGLRACRRRTAAASFYATHKRTRVSPQLRFAFQICTHTHRLVLEESIRILKQAELDNNRLLKEIAHLHAEIDSLQSQQTFHQLEFILALFLFVTALVLMLKVTVRREVDINGDKVKSEFTDKNGEFNTPRLVHTHLPPPSPRSIHFSLHTSVTTLTPQSLRRSQAMFSHVMEELTRSERKQKRQEEIDRRRSLT